MYACFVFLFLFINIIKELFFLHYLDFFQRLRMNYQTSDFVVVPEKLRVYGCWVLLNRFFYVKGYF